MLDKIMESARSILEASAHTGHDMNHALRVRDLCIYTSSVEGGDQEILIAAALLHDIGRPDELQDPSLDHALISAYLAEGILKGSGFPDDKIKQVIHSIDSHRFSTNLNPGSLEGCILQDADRLDISGALGVAMTFAYSGACGRRLHHPSDPLAEHRKPDGTMYALDHILTKLMVLPGTMNTMTARRMAKDRNRFIRTFLDQFKNEIIFPGRMDHE